MKTKENKIKKQMTMLLLIMLPLITGIYSCQKDKTLDLDITKLEWELKSITINSNKTDAPTGNFHKPDAYILKFESDNLFSLPTNTNSMWVKYEIPSKGQIIIYGTSGSQVTEAEHTEFNDSLRSTLEQTNTYTVEGKTLTFKGDNRDIKFKKNRKECDST